MIIIQYSYFGRDDVHCSHTNAPVKCIALWYLLPECCIIFTTNNTCGAGFYKAVGKGVGGFIYICSPCNAWLNRSAYALKNSSNC